jgi:hypothetical protein
LEGRTRKKCRETYNLHLLETCAKDEFITLKTGEMMSNLWSFLGGNRGPWRVESMSALCGDALAEVERLDIVNGDAKMAGATWNLQGVTSNLRYANREEVAALKAIQPVLGRAEASCAALIPIKKSAAWWNLAQDERRAIFEETSHHNAIGLEYLPAVARRLHHCRDLGGEFDFLTYFEFAPQHAGDFDEMVKRLRSQLEWEWVEREVDIRLVRES